MSQPPAPQPPTAAPESFDPQRRRLCPDGACVGLIGADGRCRTCGMVDPQGAPALGAGTFGGPASAPGGQDPDDADADEADEALASDADVDGGSGGFDASRRLCPDGGCVGVIQENQRCSVCGRTAEGV